MTTPQPAYQRLSSMFQAMLNCAESNNETWYDTWHERIEALMEDFPHGSGFNSGTQFDFAASKPERLVLLTSFHHMHESGMYDGWTEHTVIVTPSLQHGFHIHVTGRDRNEIKHYIAEMFAACLSTPQETEQ